MQSLSDGNLRLSFSGVLYSIGVRDMTDQFLIALYLKDSPFNQS